MDICMRMMFQSAIETDIEWEAFSALIGTLGDEDIDRAVARSRSRADLSESQAQAAAAQDAEQCEGDVVVSSPKEPGGSDLGQVPCSDHSRSEAPEQVQWKQRSCATPEKEEVSEQPAGAGDQHGGCRWITLARLWQAGSTRRRRRAAVEALLAAYDPASIHQCVQ